MSDKHMSYSRRDNWNLNLVPRYDEALELDSVAATHMTETLFREEYVDKNRPCLILGGAHNWQAIGKWSSIPYLRGFASESDIVTARTNVISECTFDADLSIRKSLESQNKAALKSLTFTAFLEGVENEMQYPQFSLFPLPLVPGRPLEGLLSDVDVLPFFPYIGKSKTRVYPPYRLFLYRRSYTDWHHHPADEGFLVQILGNKEILLLPPDEETWDVLWPIVCKRGYLFDVDPKAFPGFSQLRPYRTLLRPGDVLYIPVFWWHAAEAADDRFGISLAATFETPSHVSSDRRFPAARHWGSIFAQIDRARAKTAADSISNHQKT